MPPKKQKDDENELYKERRTRSKNSNDEEALTAQNPFLQ